VIEHYLRELHARLPRERRSRFLAEAEAHLRDRRDALIAAGHAPDEAERLAVESFGPVDDVARRMSAVAARYLTRRAAVAALVALAFLVVPLYLVPENTFGPAEWASKPSPVTVTQVVAVLLWLASLAVAAAAVLAAFADRARTAATLLAAAAGLACATGAAALVAGIVWLEHAPWTPLWWALGVVVPATILAVGMAAGALALVWARRQLLDVR
jgi:hypothetical protein